MIDKSDWRIPYTANLRSDFRFLQNELRYAGLYGTVRRSTHYQGTCDLRTLGIDAILHLYFRGRGEKNHKLEIIDAGEKSIDEMAQLIDCVFDIDPFKLHAMRLDFAADMFGIMRQTGHKTIATLRRYIRSGEIFRGNAAAGLGI